MVQYIPPFEAPTLSITYIKSENEMIIYEDLLITIEIVDNLLLMNINNVCNISTGILDYFKELYTKNIPKIYYNENDKKYFIYYNKISESNKDEIMKLLEDTKINLKDKLIDLLILSLDCEKIYIRYLAPNYYQVSRDGTFGQTQMSMENINFIHNNLINNITEKYLISNINEFNFDNNYLDYIYELELIKHLNINLEYLQQYLLLVRNLVNNQISITKQ